MMDSSSPLEASTLIEEAPADAAPARDATSSDAVGAADVSIIPEASSGSDSGRSSSALAATPPMGWNSWNHFAGNISQTVLEQTADALVSTGMQAAGYQYLNIDDTWASSTRDSSGNLVANPSKFRVE